jgi:glycosyltransferase involved in cell wall biosynthesis
MGADDDSMHMDRKAEIREQIREQYGVKKDDFLIVTGGKIDKNKNVHLLAETVAAIDNSRLRLLIFGNIEESVRQIIDGLNSDKIIKAGWIPSDRVYDYFYAADLVAFPGLHSVLWEQAVASRVPCAFSKIDGFDHVDVGGNAFFFEEPTVECYKESLLKVLNDSAYYAQLQKCADSDIVDVFLYSHIAEQVIEDISKV